MMAINPGRSCQLGWTWSQVLHRIKRKERTTMLWKLRHSLARGNEENPHVVVTHLEKRKISAIFGDLNVRPQQQPIKMDTLSPTYEARTFHRWKQGGDETGISRW